MESEGCPYLGRPDDENSAQARPSEGNFCFKAFPVAPVKRDHQSSTCLTGQHATCPVFLAQKAAPLPRELAPPPTGGQRTRKFLGEVSLLAAVVLLYLVSIWFGVSRVSARVMSLSNPASYGWLGLPGFAVQPAATEPLPSRLAPTAKPFSNSQFAPLVVKDCPLPPGWEPYIVQTSDSIFRISILFGISEDALEIANCLDSQAKLTPGSTLFVPVLNPTAAPTATQRPLAAPLPVIIHETVNDDPPDPAPVVEAPAVVPDNPQAAEEEEPASTSTPESQKDKDDDDRDDDKDDDDVKDENDDDDKDDDKDDDDDDKDDDKDDDDDKKDKKDKKDDDDD